MNIGLKKVKPPKIGDEIIHYEPYFDRESKGKVIQLLSSQFFKNDHMYMTIYIIFETNDSKLKKNQN